MESRIIHGKFLNIRLYNNPKTMVPLTTVLRKSQNKHNIIPPNSNTHKRYMRMAGLSYFHTARTHTGTSTELQNQFKLYTQFLEVKGLQLNRLNIWKILNQKRKKLKRDFYLKQCSTRCQIDTDIFVKLSKPVI